MHDMPFEFAKADYPLAPLTLYNVGGPARLALFPRDEAEACAAYAWMQRQPGPKIVLGGGSNILVADAGFPGIALVTSGLDRIEPAGPDRYRAGGGALLDRLVRDIMLPNNYAGVGGLAGIPGTVGGAIYMNAGTVNGTTCQLVESVELMGLEGRHAVRLDPSMYGYRGQTFCPPPTLILSGTFRFEPAEDDQRAVYDHYIERRRARQPQGRCCGSVFKNPEGDHAGRLIEQCGLKGTRRGGAVISPVHANFIMNEDAATCADIRGLIDLCKRRVLEEFGIELHEEVVTIP
ncbi:MAG: UDP-N-acetylmuramate dehydrogenase [Candidatus Hydrogenedentes bacterium]|nr:UDP-N-acetylmuramate dehydrogenase [Candidatus Hydrogenedentota bacterium]